MGRRPLQERIAAFRTSMYEAIVCGISSPFGELFPTLGQVTYVLLTRLPLSTPEGVLRSTCMRKARRQRSS